MIDAPITPPPLPMLGERLNASVGCVIVFGGSFDPPHKAHINLPLVVRQLIEKRTRADAWLLLVPAARSPHKGGARATDAQRLEMLALAVDHLPRTAVWTDELHRPPPSYTIDTVTRLRLWLDAHGGGEVSVRLLLGADQAAAFHTWREPRRLMKVAPPLVMLRGPDGEAMGKKQAAAGFWSAEELREWSEGVVPAGVMDVSSTDVRGALAAGDEAVLKRALDPRVLAYIRAHGLYAPPAARP